MSKELRCTNCGKKEITEREDTTHTTYSSGLCEECSRPTEPEPEKEQDETNPLACTVCGKPCKTEFGLKSHMRTHK